MKAGQRKKEKLIKTENYFYISRVPCVKKKSNCSYPFESLPGSVYNLFETEKYTSYHIPYFICPSPQVLQTIIITGVGNSNGN